MKRAGNSGETSRGGKRQKVMVEERRLSFELWMEGVQKEAKVTVTHSEKKVKSWIKKAVRAIDKRGNNYSVGINVHFSSRTRALATIELGVSTHSLIFQVSQSEIPDCLREFLENESYYFVTSRKKRKIMRALKDDNGIDFDCEDVSKYIWKPTSVRKRAAYDTWKDLAAKKLQMDAAQFTTIDDWKWDAEELPEDQVIAASFDVILATRIGSKFRF
ncbi:hypothetical protein FNV43_RR15765 [Rhamnella rubrinervis]|uniref:Uncharacterized protein n=1 Tax=Rhamnella rubrinervis TaxID=2594499 RepID=A0A8K0GYD7_9ROSA|nr:hypothetical protein FNV43_RR15765 [Rhamnella rubrinervis]